MIRLSPSRITPRVVVWGRPLTFVLQVLQRLRLTKSNQATLVHVVGTVPGAGRPGAHRNACSARRPVAQLPVLYQLL